MECAPVGLRFTGGSFRGDVGSAPGMAADVSDMTGRASEVLIARLS